MYYTLFLTQPMLKFMPSNEDAPNYDNNTTLHQGAQPPKAKQSRLHRCADLLHEGDITRIFRALGSFLLVLAVVPLYFEYEARDLERQIANEERVQRQLDRETAIEEREQRQLYRKVAAWQVLTVRAPGNSGKIDAIEYLNAMGEPLNGIDVSVGDGQAGVWLMGAIIPKAQLSHANLTNAKLKKADLSMSDLRYTRFNKADLTGANLNGADLSNAFLYGTNFTRANLIKADFWKADARGANFTNTNLSTANFWEANLEGAILTVANLSGANLWEANLTDVNLWEANLRNANFTMANLKKANLTNADVWMVDFTKADLTSANLSGAISLTCDQLQAATAWEQAYRDVALACGAAIPKIPSPKKIVP